MNRLRIFIPLVLAAGTLAAFGTWYWQAAGPVAEFDESVPTKIETRKLEVGLDEQRQHVGSLRDRLDAGLNNLDELEQRVASLEQRHLERATGTQTPADLPRTLEEIVAQKTRYLESRHGVDAGDQARRIRALSAGTGMPEDSIREALGR